MTTPGKGQLSPAVTGWVLALLFCGLAYFVAASWPKPPEPGPKPAPYVKPPNKLAAYGLPDNPDFETLPAMFALFSDKAGWIDNQTSFAYWHPGVQRYEYYFEATRLNGAYHFREIPEPKDESLVLDEAEVASAEWPIRFYRRAAVTKPPGIMGISFSTHDPGPPEKPSPSALKPVDVPPPDLKLPPLDSEPKK